MIDAESVDVMNLGLLFQFIDDPIEHIKACHVARLLSYCVFLTNYT